MSDLTAAAAAMGLPESLVQRSAEARAAETGGSVDEILAAWAGGAPAPSAPQPAAEQTGDEASASEPDSTENPAETSPSVPEIVIEVPDAPQTVSAPAPTGPYRPPVLVGVSDNPIGTLVGVVGLFLIIALVAVVGPGLPLDEPGARSSEIPYSEAALEGREIYASLGCASCHTQAVRPVVADVGLGAVTLNDTNQVIGLRRFGPDLADVGTRMTDDQIAAVVSGLGDHPSHTLSSEDLTVLTAYLSETRAPDGRGES